MSERGDITGVIGSIVTGQLIGPAWEACISIRRKSQPSRWPRTGGPLNGRIKGSSYGQIT